MTQPDYEVLKKTRAERDWLQRRLDDLDKQHDRLLALDAELLERYNSMMGRHLGNCESLENTLQGLLRRVGSMKPDAAQWDDLAFISERIGEIAAEAREFRNELKGTHADTVVVDDVHEFVDEETMRQYLAANDISVPEPEDEDLPF